MRLAFLPFALAALPLAQVASGETLAGHVSGGGGPIAASTVTLWAAGEETPVKLSETRSGDDGAFRVEYGAEQAGGGVLYLTARGGEPRIGSSPGANPAIALMATLGAAAPNEVTINELTTVASVWTGAQFLQGGALRGHALGLKIAAGNVPNLVDLATGGSGPVIQDPLNSTQTTSLATMNPWPPCWPAAPRARSRMPVNGCSRRRRRREGLLRPTR